MRSLPLAFLVVAACTSSPHHAPPGALQMNDLSALMPLPASQAELDAMLAPTSPGKGGQLLPQAIYAMGGAVAYTDLRVVGFRFDPCFGQLGPITDPSTCANQLRLVLQPITYDTTATPPHAVAADAAVHAFYSLTRDELTEAIEDIVAARQADAGDADLGPLAPHPVIAREGTAGTLAQAYAATIAKFAGAANLTRFTTLQVAFFNAAVGGGEFWELQGHDVVDGATVPLPIPTLPAQQASMSVSAATMPLEASEQPATTSSDSFALLASYSQASAATAAARQAAFDAALRVQNPGHHSPNTIDCGSCHLANPAVELVGAQLGLSASGNPNAFVASSAIPSADLVRTTPLIGGGADQGLNIHAFSYRLTSPMINQRVINETAANLAYLSKL